jgi:CHAT domain-containing protein
MRLGRLLPLCLALAGGQTLLAVDASADAPHGRAHARKFDGFNPTFNLGQSASGAVCEAKRTFEGAVAESGARVWNVTCRGWSNTLGQLYLFPGGVRREAETQWRKDLAARTDCADALHEGAKSECHTKPANLAYVVFAPGTRSVAAEGKAPIQDVLGVGIRFLSREIAEPAAVDAASASVGKVSSAPVSDLDKGVAPSSDSLRSNAYSYGQDWRFNEAETDFATLASTSEGATRAEALYNQALNASNKGRFDEADIYFEQADALSADADSSLKGLGLNYHAADDRNRRDYEAAIADADDAIRTRKASGLSTVHVNASGQLVIPEIESADGTHRVSLIDRDRLRDAQAYEIKGTALEAQGDRAGAREALLEALAILDSPAPQQEPSQLPKVLGEVTPWLDTRVLADLLRLDRGTPAEADTQKKFRAAVTRFSIKHPGALPLAGFYLEQANAEAPDPSKESLAVSDYKEAFKIFIDQRGALADSSDLAAPYFDFLLKRIADAPGAHHQDVVDFFDAAQALIAQSSADAAKRQAAIIQAGDTRAAGLARALDDTVRLQNLNEAELRRLNEQGLYRGGEVDRVTAQRNQLAEQNKTLQDELLQAEPGYTSALKTLVSLEILQKDLKPGEVYAKVFLLSDRGYGILVTPTEAIPYRIDLTRTQAQAMVAKLREPIDKPTLSKDGKRRFYTYFDVGLSHQVFLDIFAPVQAQVLAAKHIIYEPDSSLIPIPISALVVDDASKTLIDSRLASSKPLDYVGVAWLGARTASSIALSASAFHQARKAPPSAAANAFFGFADPDIPRDPADFASVRPSGPATKSDEELCADYRYSLSVLAPLPDTETEVKGVAASLGAAATYLTGDSFTDTAVLTRGAAGGQLGTYKVLYFATHGILDQSNPCLQAALVTSYGGQGSDALLDLRKIPSLHLDADLVVLSACNTGSNSDTAAATPTQSSAADPTKPGVRVRPRAHAPSKAAGAAGEALGGFVTTFVEAGARNVLVSNWEVDSAMTVRLMTTMFQSRDMSQADALVRAERVLMDEPRHSHPYYWAPFMVVGDGGRTMPGSGASASGATASGAPAN